MNRVCVKVIAATLLVCSVLGVTGCGSKSAGDAKAEAAAFAGNPNSPQARAAAQSAAADTAKKAAAARAAAATAPKPPAR